MNAFTKHVAVAAVLACAPLAANAAIVQFFTPETTIPAAAAPVNETIVANKDYPYGVAGTGTDSQLYTFTADGPVRVGNVTFTSNGASADVAKTGIAFDGGPITSFVPSGTGSATGVLDFNGFDLADGESFTFLINYMDVTDPTLITANFRTSPVPVPAALPLMIGGIAALGVVKRRKTAKA